VLAAEALLSEQWAALGVVGSSGWDEGASASSASSAALPLPLLPPEEVVVVLGYKMFGDGVPSPLLHLRLAAAARALTEASAKGPVTLLLSGGVPPDVPGRSGLSEAEAMRIHMRRCFPRVFDSSNVAVILEPAAHSTHTNALNTLAKLLETDGAATGAGSTGSTPQGQHRRRLSLTVATNRYHQLRSLRVFRAAARELGLTAATLRLRAAPIPPSLAVAAQGSYTACHGGPAVAGGVVTASTSRSSSVWEQGAMACDTSAQSYWQAGGPAPQWLSWAPAGAGAAPERLCGYALTVRREPCCVTAHSPSRWQLQRAPMRTGSLPADEDWVVLHGVDGSEGVAQWTAGERKSFELPEQPAAGAGHQFRLLVLETGTAGECASGANGTEVWRGRHRCNQQAGASGWREWLGWARDHAWHHGLPAGDAPERAPVLAGLELLGCAGDMPDAAGGAPASAVGEPDWFGAAAAAPEAGLRGWLAELSVELAWEVAALAYYAACGRLDLRGGVEF